VLVVGSDPTPLSIISTLKSSIVPQLGILERGNSKLTYPPKFPASFPRAG
jgi:hypothetical protein